MPVDPELALPTESRPRRSLKLLVIAGCAIATPVVVLIALALVVNRPVYSVKSSSWSSDRRFRVDSESGHTFDVSYGRVRLVRADDETDSRVFCERAGSELVGTWVADNSFIITIPEYAGRSPTPDVFSVRVDFDPADLGTATMAPLGGSGRC